LEFAVAKGGEGKPGAARGGARVRGGQSYGIDDPLTVLGLAIGGAFIVGFGLLGLSIESKVGSVVSFSILLLGFVVGFLLLLLAFSSYLSSRSWKPRELERLGSLLPWGGNELVLDVGCGRGLFSNVVADEVPTGAVVALDLWRKRDLSGNDPRSVLKNAETRGIRQMILLVKADPRFLPFASGVFDAVVSGLAINHIKGSQGKALSLKETVRVLKGGGRLALLIAGSGRDTLHVLEKETLRDLKVSSLRLGVSPLAHSVVARKSFSPSG
jgi:ubiquinone/menaquinone biosynthesis C-methylase UbiE